MADTLGCAQHLGCGPEPVEHRLWATHAWYAASDFQCCWGAGPNGCGKSTLLRLVMGREKPIKGAVELGEYAIEPNYFEQNQVRSSRRCAEACRSAPTAGCARVGLPWSNASSRGLEGCMHAVAGNSRTRLDAFERDRAPGLRGEHRVAAGVSLPQGTACLLGSRQLTGAGDCSHLIPRQIAAPSARAEEPPTPRGSKRAPRMGARRRRRWTRT